MHPETGLSTRFFIFVLTLLPQISFATDWFVRANAGGNGTSWASAWSDVTNISWSSIQPGDTLWIAGGSYGILSLGKSGNADTPTGRIFIKRATSLSHGSDSGWNSAYDSQVVLSSIRWETLNVGSYVTIDGQVDNGISIPHGDADGVSSITFDRGVSYVTLRYLDVKGPGGYLDRDGNTRGADGFFDIGAYEYNNGTVTSPLQLQAPRNLRLL